MNGVQGLFLVVLLLLPAIATASVTLPILGWSGTLLSALPLSIGINYAVSLMAGVIGLRVSGTTYLVYNATLFGICILGRLRTAKLRLADRPIHSEMSMIALLTSLLVSSLLLIVWLNASGSLAQLLPNHDAMYHAYAIRNIMSTGSISASKALQIFPIGSGSAANFYPLGAHALIASAVSIAHVSIPGAMNLMAVGLGACFLPFAMSYFCLEYFDSRFASAVAPLAVLSVAPIFPWSPFSWGGLPTIVGMAIAPAAAASIRRLYGSKSRLSLVLMSLIVVGMFSIHTPELITTLLLVVLLGSIVGFGTKRRWKEHLLRMFKVGALSALLISPVIHVAILGVQERDIQYQAKLDPITLAGQISTFSLTGYTMLALSTLVLFCLATARTIANRRLSILLIGLIGLEFVAGVNPSNSLVHAVTKPWYGQVLRLNYNTAYLIVALIAGIAVDQFGKQKPNIRRRSPLLHIVVVGFMVLSIFILSIERSHEVSRALLKSWYSELVPPNADSITAYHWMSSHMSSIEYVLTDKETIDESLWMYAISGAKPVIYSATTADNRDKYFGIKIRILENIGNLDKFPEILKWISDTDVRFFYFDERTNAISPAHTVSLDQLRSDTHLREVFTQKTAHVFEFAN